MRACVEGGQLVIRLEGRISADNAAEVDAGIRWEIASHPGMAVCLDADRLTYISSSGLRILLGLRKELAQPLVIRNVSAEVYGIFEITGFISLMDIRRKPREISTEGCAIVGEGAFGTVYRLDDDTVVKVYRSVEEALPMIDKEREWARKAFLLGIPTAIPFDTVRVGSRYGIVFEMVNAKSLNELVIREPERLEETIDRYARFLKSIHALTTAPGQLQDARDRYADYLQRVSPVLQERACEQLKALIRAMPEDLHLLHGDAHLKNIMDSNGALMFIDMDTLCAGDPVFEFAGLYMSYVAFNEDEPDNSKMFYGIDGETTARICHEGLDRYLGHPGAAALREAEKKIALLGSLRFLYVLMVEQAADRSELKERRIRHAAERIAGLISAVGSLSLCDTDKGGAAPRE